MNLQIAAVQLYQTKGLGVKTLSRILTMLGREKRALQDISGASTEELMSKYQLKLDVAESFAASRSEAEELVAELEESGVIVLVKGISPYPQRLVDMLGEEAPPILFVQGNAKLLEKPAVGFCGSRKATKKGLEVAHNSAFLLAKAGLNIVSGYAQGVDLATHQAALEASSNTIFVLAEGIFHFKKKSDIADRLTDKNYVAVSELPPKLPWIGRNAMRRNRIICALSNAMILVESSIKGGTFAAGESALEMGIPLFVAHYSDDAKAYEGNNYFLAQGARPLRGDNQGVPNLTNIFQELQITPPNDQVGNGQTKMFV